MEGDHTAKGLKGKLVTKPKPLRFAVFVPHLRPDPGDEVPVSPRKEGVPLRLKLADVGCLGKTVSHRSNSNRWWWFGKE